MGKQVIRLYRSEGGGSKKEPLVVETEPQWPRNQATVVQKPDHFGVENTHPCVIHTQGMRTGKITAMKVGRTYRIPKVHLLTYLRVLDADRAS